MSNKSSFNWSSENLEGKTFTLNVEQKKNGKFRYYVTCDQTGEVVSDRESYRKYVACTASGSNYYGRVDLVAKDKHQSMYEAEMKSQGKIPVPIAYLAELKPKLFIK